MPKEKGIGLVVIGPEAPLVVGVADAVHEPVLHALANGNAAQMEGSRGVLLKVMERANVPTAA